MNVNARQKEIKEKFFKAVSGELDIAAIADDEIGEMKSQITYYDPFCGGQRLEGEAFETALKASKNQSMLKSRLSELNANTPAPRPPVRYGTKCDCGHYDDYPMTTSTGTSCAMCYDRMS